MTTVRQRGKLDATALSRRPGGPTLIEGRWPTEAELARGDQVAVITRGTARTHFGGAPPIGQLLRSGSEPGTAAFEVIGVAEPARYPAWDSDPWNQIYAPYRSMAWSPRTTLVVRTTRMHDILAWAMREAREPTGDARLVTAAAADELLLDRIRPRRFESWVFASFSTAALAIVGVGILGLVAMTSARRRREIGIRLALGAARQRIVRLLLREQLAAVVLGTMAGIAGGLAARMAIGAHVYGLLPWDARIWTVAITTVVLTAVVGTLIPAGRASRVNPGEVLRSE